MFSLRSALIAGLALSAVAGSAAQASAQSINNYNYIGAGVSDEGFVINGKATLSDTLSLRPAAFTEFDDFTFLVPVTYDFNPIAQTGEDKLLPFAGGGVRVDTEGDENFAILLTGGVDYRITDKWVANGSAHASFIGDTEFDFILGVGYSF